MEWKERMGWKGRCRGGVNEMRGVEMEGEGSGGESMEGKG